MRSATGSGRPSLLYLTEGQASVHKAAAAMIEALPRAGTRQSRPRAEAGERRGTETIYPPRI
jgi:hypothetical protein